MSDSRFDDASPPAMLAALAARLREPSRTRPPAGGFAPGAWLGLLGGGQLGRMFCMAAQSLGYRVCVLDPDEDGPAAATADAHLRAAYDDADALDRLAARCVAVTTEFENVPAASLARLTGSVVVAPTASAVAVAQDRRLEKRFIRAAGVDVAPYAEIDTAADLDDVAKTPDALFPAILKLARLGYDGKGQARVADRAEARAAFARMGARPCVLERRVPLAIEVSVVLARGFDGEIAAYPVAENVHRDGILAVTTVPARIGPALAERALEAAARIAAALDYVGVLCVEFFVLDDGRLLANEMAPRPHNSGHYTIDACVGSQFEQQARVMAGLPLGSVRQREPAVMLNLLGDCWRAGEPDWAAVLAHPQARLHLYGKRDARPGRKMGHVTVVGPALGEVVDVAARIERRLRIVESAGDTPRSA
ncbi:MAG: 5-(carboxyamino)imidazole ribonucleotide synthase [Burkholderiaceae bacterium]